MNHNQIVKDDEKFLGEIGVVTHVAWQPPRDITFEEWEHIGATLQQVGASLNWWIGDWLNFGEAQYGETYAQAVETTGWEYQRLANAKYVANRVEISRRKENLSWTHHEKVAKFDPQQQQDWLNLAETNNWSSKELQQNIILDKEQREIEGEVESDGAVPFNHQTRENLDEGEVTPVDEYEQEQDGFEELKPSVHFSSESVEHFTPQKIIDAVLSVMGEIDLDPCSNEKEYPHVPAKLHYTIEEDGLAQEWQGRVFMNPPYGKDIEHWIDKLCESFYEGTMTEAIALVPARTDTQWWLRLNQFFPFVCFVEGRLTFANNESPAPFPSAIVYLGDNIKQFYTTFIGFGELWQKLSYEMFEEN